MSKKEVEELFNENGIGSPPPANQVNAFGAGEIGEGDESDDEAFDEFSGFDGEPNGWNQPQTDVTGEKCHACGDNMQFDPVSGQLKCPSCGTKRAIVSGAGQEIAYANLASATGTWQNETHVYHCSNCNAEEALDKREIAHVCPFCGSPSVVEREEMDTLKPNAVLPFAFNSEKASELAVKWAKKKWLAPNDFKTYFHPEKISGAYLPAFTFDTNVTAKYRGRLGRYYYVTVKRNGKTEQVRKVRYFSVWGTYENFYDDIAVNATSTDVIPPRTMKKLLQYDYHSSMQYTEDYLYGFSALLYSKDGETCWQEAQIDAEGRTRRGILSRYHYDVVQYLNVNSNYWGVTYKYLLLPMYLGNYSYRNKPYKFYINGRSGKLKGKSPVSPINATLFSLACALVAAGIGYLIYLFV